MTVLRTGTLAVARLFQSEGVKVVTQPNMGAAAARNRALQLAQGTYIQWLDADDLLAPDKIMNQMRLAEQCGDSRVLLSSPWAYFKYRSTAAKFVPTALWQDCAPVEWIVCKWTHNLHMQTATWLVSRELSNAAGPWNTELLGDDDGEYFTRVVLASRKVCFVDRRGSVLSGRCRKPIEPYRALGPETRGAPARDGAADWVRPAR